MLRAVVGGGEELKERGWDGMQVGEEREERRGEEGIGERRREA